MKETPILFTAEMVRAILDGRKTQTRRIVKPQPVPHDFGEGGVRDAFVQPQTVPGMVAVGAHVIKTGDTGYLRKLPYGTASDRLWVKENWADVNTENGPAITYGADHSLHFCTDDAYPVEYDRYPGCQFTMWCSDLWNREERACKSDHHWRPSIYMPRWASRLLLEITNVRVERLQDISEEDAIAEGITESWPEIECNSDRPYRDGYRWLWESINSKTAPWASNPWTWVIHFKKL